MEDKLNNMHDGSVVKLVVVQTSKVIHGVHH
jgi:hypothetical protein